MIRPCRCGSGHTFETGNEPGWQTMRWAPDCTSLAAARALAHREYLRTYMRMRRFRAERRAEADAIRQLKESK